MRTCMTAVLCLAAAAIGLIRCGKTADLKVMSYNIRYDNPGDGDNTWSRRRDRVFDLIRREQPDVVGMQEALHNQIGDLAAALPPYDWYGVGRDDGAESGEFAPIFYRRERFDHVDSGSFWISPTPDQPGSVGWDAALTRIVSWVRLRDRISHREVFFFNAHFDHRGEASRRQGALLLRRRVQAICAGIPAVVTGDFNFTPESQAYTNLTRPAAPDADMAALHDAARPHGAGEPVLRGTCCGFAVEQDHDRRIDYILSSEPFTVKDYRVITSQHQGSYPSDHLPVVVVFAPEH